MKRSSIKFLNLFLRVAGVIVLLTLLVASLAYYQIWKAHPMWNSNEPNRVLYIHSGTDWNQLQNHIDTSLPNVQISLFEFMGERMNLNNHIHYGRYELEKNLSLVELIRRLRSGVQNPVLVTIPEIESVTEALIRGTRNLQIDSIQIISYLKQNKDWKQHPHWVIPNTYEMYWDVTVENYMDRIYREGKNFWQQAKQKEKLGALGLDAKEAYILASIVDRETNSIKEMDRIAGVYYNRLEINMPLQADPTIKYLLPKGVTRILYKDLEIDSPYNTYRNTGLPPGPLGLASLNSINSVLELEDHNYLYFCANPEQPGTHSFSKTYSEHLRNAQKYHRSLKKG